MRSNSLGHLRPPRTERKEPRRRLNGPSGGGLIISPLAGHYLIAHAAAGAGTGQLLLGGPASCLVRWLRRRPASELGRRPRAALFEIGRRPLNRPRAASGCARSRPLIGPIDRFPFIFLRPLPLRAPDGLPARLLPAGAAAKSGRALGTEATKSNCPPAPIAARPDVDAAGPQLKPGLSAN